MHTKSKAIPDTQERISTGIKGLDNVLKGGLPKGHLYLVDGDPGTGKTTLALQFLSAGAALGEKVLYITLSETKRELNAVAASHGWDLKDVHIHEMMALEDELKPEAQYTVFHPSEVELADTISSLVKVAEELNPQRVVFDSLSDLRMLARDGLRYRRQILALKHFFAGRNCTVLLLDDRTTTESDLQLQSIAHGVLLLQSIDRDFGVKRRRLEVRKLRGSRYREGYHDFTIETGGLAVSPRLVASDYRMESERRVFSSGLKELDELLAGGIETASSTLLMGPPGCGKSTVASQYVYSAAKRGEKVLILSFDETLSTLLHRCKGLSMDLRPLIDKGNIFLQQVQPAELSPGEFVSMVREYVETRGVKLVLIDSINGLLNAMPDERFLTLQLHELLSFLSQQGVATIMTLAQGGLIGMNMVSPVDVTYLADTVLLCRYFEAGGSIRQAISVVKKRSGSHERTIRELIMANGKLRVGPALTRFEGILTGVPRVVEPRSILNEEPGLMHLTPTVSKTKRPLTAPAKTKSAMLKPRGKK